MWALGFPSLRQILSEATSYTERLFEYWQIGPLSDDAIRAALKGPTTAHGVRWDPEALDAGVEFCRGYPYFAQVLGQRAWDVAEGTPIARDAVAEAIRYAGRDIDAGCMPLAGSAPPAASNGSYRLWLIRAGTGAHVGAGDGAGKRPTAQLSPTRNQLISKGLVYAPDRGEVDFTVPGWRSS